MILPGFTDSRHFRAAFPECVAYGFFPQRHQSLLETAPLVHGADERIDVRDLQFATEFFGDLATARARLSAARAAARAIGTSRRARVWRSAQACTGFGEKSLA